MNEIFDITGSIVIFEENMQELMNTIDCFSSISLSKKLFIIDNNKTPKNDAFKKYNFIEYIKTKKNLGFGTGHNQILEKIKNQSKYHLILNPDVFFTSETITTLIHQLNSDNSLAMIAPKVTFLDGSHQFSCRRYPQPLELIARRSVLFRSFLKKMVDLGEYKDKDLHQPFYCEYLTGCFQLYKTRDFIAINGFDERYFLYMEDVDICRKIDQLEKKKLYYPKVEIVHILKQGSLRKINLFFRHLSSAVKYYLKWGI